MEKILLDIADELSVIRDILADIREQGEMVIRRRDAEVETDRMIKKYIMKITEESEKSLHKISLEQ